MFATRDFTPFIPDLSSRYWGEFRARTIGRGLDPATSMPLFSRKPTIWLYASDPPWWEYTATAPPTFPRRPRSLFSRTSAALSRKVCITLGHAPE